MTMNTEPCRGNFPFNVLLLRPATFLTLHTIPSRYSNTHIILSVDCTHCLGEGPGSLIIPVREDQILGFRDFEMTPHPSFGLRSICGCTGIMLCLLIHVAKLLRDQEVPQCSESSPGASPCNFRARNCLGLVFPCLLLLASAVGFSSHPYIFMSLPPL